MLELTNIVKKYFIGEENELTVLKNLNISIQEGEFVSIGASPVRAKVP